MARLCLLFGLTRQAYYQQLWCKQEANYEHELVLKEVLKIRARHPRIGTRKLYVLLEPFMLEYRIKNGERCFVWLVD